MKLYNSPTSVHCHRTRIVLTEKDITFDTIEIESVRKIPEDLADLNPYGSVPTLVDRDLVLYSSRVIIEYLDERFPHPPLMPVDPVSRAKSRLALYRVENDWYTLIKDIETKGEKTVMKAKNMLGESIISASDIFNVKPYFLSDEFSLIDASIAPVLWRLPLYGIELPREAKAVKNYADRVFARDAFQASLTEKEREMRL